jgi:hypothetical protein
MNKTEILLKVALNTINHKPTSFDTCINFIILCFKHQDNNGNIEDEELCGFLKDLMELVEEVCGFVNDK